MKIPQKIIDSAEYGIYIRGKRIMDMILDREKIMETRTHNRLDRFISHWVGLIQTGNGKPKLVGYAYVMDSFKFHDLDEWDKYRSMHRIAEGSKYDWDLNTNKYGYLLGDVMKLDSPIELPSIKGNRMWRELK